MTDTPRKDKGKAMKPPADATHCGGYPTDTSTPDLTAPEHVFVQMDYPNQCNLAFMARCKQTNGRIEYVRTDIPAARIAELEAKNARLLEEIAALKSPPEEYCAQCGSPKSNHPYRHPFTPSAALDKDRAP